TGGPGCGPSACASAARSTEGADCRTPPPGPGRAGASRCRHPESESAHQPELRYKKCCRRSGWWPSREWEWSRAHPRILCAARSRNCGGQDRGRVLPLWEPRALVYFCCLTAFPWFGHSRLPVRAWPKALLAGRSEERREGKSVEG